MSDIAIPLDRVGRALRRSGGNMHQAAVELKITRIELRALVNRNPELLDQALEATERALDKAEAALRQALRDGEPRQRIAAAGHIVRRSSRFR